ncbi:MAG: efflux RND transporter periplasmic adaptor subunit [Myxococcota bacterium]
MTTLPTEPHRQGSELDQAVTGAERGRWLPTAAGVVLLVGAGLFATSTLLGGGKGDAVATPGGAPGQGHGAGKAGSGSTVPVRLHVAARGELARERRVPGEVVAAQRAALHAEVGGAVAQIARRLGEQVNVGEVLVSLDPGVLPAELRRAEASAEIAAARAVRATIMLEQRAKDAARVKNLAGEGAASAAELERVLTEERTANADVDLAKAEARRADAEVETLRVRLAQTKVRAPFRGRIAALHVDVGTTVSPGRLLLEVVGDDDPLVRFALAEGEVGALDVGARVEVLTAGASLTAEVLRAGAALDPESRTLPIEARLLNDGDRSPRALPGSFVEVKLAAIAPPDAVIVPLAALSGRGPERTAFVVEDNVAKARSVRVLLDDGRQAAIRGIDEGTAVVSSGAAELRDGQSVEVLQ